MQEGDITTYRFSATEMKNRIRWERPIQPSTEPTTKMLKSSSIQLNFHKCTSSRARVGNSIRPTRTESAQVLEVYKSVGYSANYFLALAETQKSSFFQGSSRWWGVNYHFWEFWGIFPFIELIRRKIKSINPKRGINFQSIHSKLFALPTQCILNPEKEYRQVGEGAMKPQRHSGNTGQ